MTAPVQRTTVEGVLANHEKRVGILEATPSSFSTQREQLFGNAVNIANNAQADLTWDTKLSGDDLLDLTNPALPTVVTSGVYAVSATVLADPMTAGGFFTAFLALDAAAENAYVGPTFSAVQAALQLSLGLSCTYYIPAGGQVEVLVYNQDGANAVNFVLGLGVVQQIS